MRNRIQGGVVPPHVTAKPYGWPHDFKKGSKAFGTQNTALVVIDMQRDFCEPGGYLAYQGYDISATRAVIPAIQRVLSSCRAASLPIYHTREGHRPDLSDASSRELFRSKCNASGLGIGDEGPLGRILVRSEPGHDTIREVYPQPGECVIDKPGKGAFANTDFELLLRVQGVRNLILCGVTTDVCVHTTMREANDRGFECLLVEDCCAASVQRLHEAAVEMVKTEGGIFGAVADSKAVVEAINALR